MRQLYAGCDLHGNNNLIGIIDGEGKRVFKKKLSNDLSLVLDTQAVSGRDCRDCGGIDVQLVLVGGWADGEGV